MGCSKNEIDSELMKSILQKEGYILTKEYDKADIIIVNTCGFIKTAKEESIKAIWEMTEYKTMGKCKYLILAGCLAERYSKELMEEISEVDGIIGTGNIKDIAKIIKELKMKENRICNVKNIDSDYVEDIQRITDGYTSYLKISEGCDNFCSYCIIPKLRGRYRSRRMENIIEEARNLSKNGTKELILIAQNTTDYGIDIYGEYKLPQLLNELNKIKGIRWIRILYMYPDNFTKELISAISQCEKVVKYVDIPIQHINDYILKKMNRNISKENITNLIYSLRKNIPDIIIRTTLIVGFPGEKEEYFNELVEYVKSVKFDRLGVFTYSREEGTAAYNFDVQIPERIKNLRRDMIMKVQQNISAQKNKEKLNHIYPAMVEEQLEEDLYAGRTYMDSPEIDGVLYIESNEELQIGDFYNVRITDSLEYDLIGEVYHEFT